MSVKVVRRENEKCHRVTELKELFFYTLYKFNAYWHIGIVEKKTSNRLKSKLGVNLLGYKIELDSTHLKHFLYSHFNEKRNNQRDVHFEDIENMNDLINYYTNAEWGNAKDRILFERKTPNGTFELVVEIDYVKKILSGVSFRIKT